MIDKIDEKGVATLITSRNLYSQTYKKGEIIENIIKRDVDRIANTYGKNVWGDRRPIRADQIKVRKVQMVIPNVELSKEQITGINNAIDYAKRKNVEILLTVGVTK